MQAHGFRYYFTPLPAVLFTFPSRYLCAIGLPGVLSLGGWCRQLRTGFLRPRPTQGSDWVRHRFAYGAVTRCGPPSQARPATVPSSVSSALQPRARLDARGLGWSPFARRYSGSNCCSPLLRLLRCFSSAGSPPPSVDAAVACGGLPHSDIRGSWAVRASPRPFAAFRVLLRLREPRHPPCALWYLSRTAPVRRLPATVVLPMCSYSSRCRTSALWRTSASLLSLLVFPSILSKNRGRSGLPLVESKGVEPLTPSLQSWCSSQLS